MTLLSSLEFNRGVTEILIDGKSFGKVDLYAPRNATRRQVEVFKTDGLTPGKHTIRVVTTGEKNEAAEGTYVEIDAFVIRNTVSAASFIAEKLTVLPLSSATEVVLTFTVRADGKEATAVIPVTVPAYLPSFSDGVIREEAPGIDRIATSDFSAFVSSSRAEEGKSNLRFLLAADLEVLADNDGLCLTVVFEDEAGNRVKSLTKNAVTELSFYREVLAGGRTCRAEEGSALFGFVITDVPDNAWQRVRVVLSTGEEISSAFMGGILTAEALFA